MERAEVEALAVVTVEDAAVEEEALVWYSGSSWWYTIGFGRSILQGDEIQVNDSVGCAEVEVVAVVVVVMVGVLVVDASAEYDRRIRRL